MEKKFTFIRIPKNASTSIYEHIKPLNTITDEVLPQRETAIRPSHCKLSEAVEVLGEEILDKVVFAVSRNPYDRMVSQYHFVQKTSLIPIVVEYEFGQVINLQFKNFAEFVDFCAEEESVVSHSQSYYLDVDTDINILRFEFLQQDFSELLSKNNILIDPILPHENQILHDHYSEYYDSALKDKVKEMWKEDFKRFNYN